VKPQIFSFGDRKTLSGRECHVFRETLEEPRVSGFNFIFVNFILLRALVIENPQNKNVEKIAPPVITKSSMHQNGCEYQDAW